MKIGDEIIIQAIKNGKLIKRKNWEDKFAVRKLINSDDPMDIVKYIRQEDVFEDDWVVVGK